MSKETVLGPVAALELLPFILLVVAIVARLTPEITRLRRSFGRR